MNTKTKLDMAFVREQFPGLQNGWTLFDNAGGTQILSRCVTRLNEFLFNMNVQTGGSYELSVKAADALLAGRTAMMHLINARQAEEIAFAASSTVALQNLATSMRSQLYPGDEIIITVTDHESNIGPWARLEEAGIKIRTWQVDKHELQLDTDELRKLMTPRTKLVAVTYVSNILGTINPIADIARVVHENNAQICVDAVAYVPHRAIDVQALDVDYLVFSLYKVFGPHFAVLYGKHEHFLELDNLYHYFYGKDKVPAKLEPGNASYELAYSATGIVDYLVELGDRAGASGTQNQKIRSAFEVIAGHEVLLGERLLSYLRSRNDCRIIGCAASDENQRVPTISFVVEGHDSGEIAKSLDAYNIAIRFGDFHARRLAEFLALERYNGCVRVSMAHYNTLDEVDALIAALDETLV